MKVLKKVLLFAAIAVLALALLGGCSKKTPAAEGTAVTEEESEGYVFETSSGVTVDLDDEEPADEETEGEEAAE
jgi:hypothetical protein